MGKIPARIGSFGFFQIVFQSITPDPANMNIRKSLPLLLLSAGLLALLVACEKKDTFQSAAVDEYLNLAVGKFVRYRLDSTRYINFGQKDTVFKYQAKEVVEGTLTDNQGRPGWRIVRYMSDSSGTAPWVPVTTISLIPTRESVEVVENNLRMLKLMLPIKEGFSWKGNSYIDTYSINSEVRYMEGWDYTYEDLDQPFTVWNNVSVPNTVTVNQRDEVIGIPTDPNAYSEKTFSKEVYGKGIGLIYRDFLHWEYQPPNGGNPGYKNGYGLKMVMIDHN